MVITRSRLVVLGTGFGAFNIVKRISDDYDVTVISPRNHFLFTPLLPSTTVGTIEFRSIIEPIRYARRRIIFYHAEAIDVLTESKTVSCVGVGTQQKFEVPFDVLVIAVGAVSNSFGIPGVETHAYFLKELADARALRQRIIQCFELANLPETTVERREQLLHFVVCGGGPTGVEFAAELNDFLQEDLQKSYAHVLPEARITLVEAASEILSTFDQKLRHYATALFRRQRITVLTDSPVTKVDDGVLYLNDGSKLLFGLLLWSTGNGPTKLANTVRLHKDERSRFLVDRFFRVQGQENIYAMGDCSAVEGAPLPATSQVAQQQGKYLAQALNRRVRKQSVEPFEYHHLGMLAYVGNNKALADLQNFKGRGLATWLFWRSAYLSRSVSVKNKVLVMFDWMKAKVFGRDISQF